LLAQRCWEKSILGISNGFIRFWFGVGAAGYRPPMSPFVVSFRIAKNGDYIGNKSDLPLYLRPFGN
jgi:hypothetical protein